MSWKNSVDSAVRELKKEEQSIQQELKTVRQKISELTRLTQSSKSRGRSAGGSPKRAKRRLSASGREAISKAAKKRWAKFHAEKKAQSEK
ncbi:MAG: hypothetical protein J4G09_07760 [Proteobacteria bacterium]|nr:hypothetical protein [Pseudomonadota bacterium]